MFANANAPDRAQYKRSVFLIQRQGVVWDLRTIVPIYRGQQLAYWHCHLIPLNQNTMGSPAGYNPFATTFEYESDKPYACFSCQTDIRFAEQLSDPYLPITEPVALSLGDVSAYVLRGGAETIKAVSLTAMYVPSMDHQSHTFTDSAWNVNNANIKYVFVETVYGDDWILGFLPEPLSSYDNLNYALNRSFTVTGNGNEYFHVDAPYLDTTGQRSIHLWFSGITRDESGRITAYPDAFATRVSVNGIA